MAHLGSFIPVVCVSAGGVAVTLVGHPFGEMGQGTCSPGRVSHVCLYSRSRLHLGRSRIKFCFSPRFSGLPLRP